MTEMFPPYISLVRLETKRPKMNELEPCQQTLQISTHNSQKQKRYSVLKIISRSGKKKLVPYAGDHKVPFVPDPEISIKMFRFDNYYTDCKSMFSLLFHVY